MNEKSKRKLQVSIPDFPRVAKTNQQDNQTSIWRGEAEVIRECLETEVPELEPKGPVRANHIEGEVRVYIEEAVCLELRGKTCGKTLRNLARTCCVGWG